MWELQAEVGQVAGPPGHADLAGLGFTRMVIREALRLYPAFPMFSGRGQRLCIGEAIALTTAQIVAVTILRSYDAELPGGSLPPGHYAMTCTPENGLPVIRRPRA